MTTDNPSDPSAESDIDNLKQQVQDKFGIDLDADWQREVSAEEILYLLDRCPFLQIVDAGVSESQQDFQVDEAKASGWDIHNYGDALSSSPGKFLMGGGYFSMSANEGDDDEGGSGGQVINPGRGTIVNQAFLTAMEMVELAKAQGWQQIRFIDGHPLMARAAWIKSRRLGMSMQDFTPTEYDEEVYFRLSLSETDYELLRADVKSQGPTAA